MLSMNQGIPNDLLHRIEQPVSSSLVLDPVVIQPDSNAFLTCVASNSPTSGGENEVPLILISFKFMYGHKHFRDYFLSIYLICFLLSSMIYFNLIFQTLLINTQVK